MVDVFPVTHPPTPEPPLCAVLCCVQVAKWTFENGMGTIMLQAGELPTPARLAYLQVHMLMRKSRVASDLVMVLWNEVGLQVVSP